MNCENRHAGGTVYVIDSLEGDAPMKVRSLCRDIGSRSSYSSGSRSRSLTSEAEASERAGYRVRIGAGIVIGVVVSVG